MYSKVLGRRFMNGLMMNTPLLIKNIALHAERLHGDAEIVSILADGKKHRYTFRESMARAKRLSSALATLGISRLGSYTMAYPVQREYYTPSILGCSASN